VAINISQEIKNYLHSIKKYFVDSHKQEICLSAKQGKEAIKVPPEVP